MDEELVEGRGCPSCSAWGCICGTQSPAALLRAPLLGQSCPLCLWAVWEWELNSPLASLLMRPNWEVPLAVSRDKMPCRGIQVDGHTGLSMIHGMKFNNSKCQVLHLGWCNTRHRYKGRGEAEEKPCRKGDLRVLVSSSSSVWVSRAFCDSPAPGVHHTQHHQLAKRSVFLDVFRAGAGSAQVPTIKEGYKGP